jgi:FkbM family methyltransferase
MNHTSKAIDPTMAIEVMYQAVLGRPSDPAGLSCYYQAYVNDGLSLNQIFKCLKDSPEYSLLYPKKGDENHFSTKKCLVNKMQLYLPINDWVYFGIVSGNDCTYEPHVATTMEQILHEGGTFLDVGANIGVHTSLASQLVGPNGLVIAVEASLANAIVLKMNVAEAVNKNTVILPLPASSEVEIMTFSDVPNCSNQYVIDARRAGAAESLQTPTIKQIGLPLDLILGKLPRIDLIKMDIEGHEQSALTGLKDTIERSNRPPIIAEYTKLAGSVNYVDFLFSLGYAARIIHANGDLGVATKTAVDLERVFTPLVPQAYHCDILFTAQKSSKDPEP